MRRIILLGVTLTVFLASGYAQASTRVITPARALNELAARTPDAAKAAYEHGFGTINMEDSTHDIPGMGTRVYGFSSVRTFKAANIESGSWVMYDLEWTQDQVKNPDWQLRYPKAAIRSFLTLAHSRGLKVILTVGLGVVERVPTAACQRRKGEQLVDAFLRCGIVAAANKFHADKFMVLTQRYVCDPPKYRAATTQIADAFVGPVYAELSVLPARDCISAKRIYWNYRHVADAGAVEGLALWTSGQPGQRPYEGQLVMAAKVLELLAADSTTPPHNTVLPAISGTSTVGHRLTCSQGAWSGSMPLTYDRRWLRDGTAISGATAATYLVRSADHGHSLRCRVTAHNAAGSASAKSAARNVP